MTRLLNRLASSTVLLASVTTAASASDYAVIDLGTILPDATAAPGSIAHAVSAEAGGRVVGESVLGDLEGRLHAFVWSSDMGMVALEPPPGLLHSMATAITADGTVFGIAYDLGSGTTRAVRWTGTTPEDLGPFEVTGAAGDGTLVGGTTDGDAALHRRAVRWSGGSLENLPGLGGRDSIAHAIAADGSVAGTCSRTNESQTRAVLWRDGGVIDLGTLGGPSSRGRAVATGGRGAGDADLPGGVFHGCLFTVDAGGTVQRLDLGSLDGATSSARGINEAGVIVGTSASRAVIWENGVIDDLNARIPADSGWQLAVAIAIDTDGHITGSGLHDGQPRAFLLRPRSPGDVDGDGEIGLSDLLVVLAQWGPCGGCAGDIDGDGLVGFSDLLLVLNGWNV